MSLSFLPNFPKRTEDVNFLEEYSTKGNQKAIANLNELTDIRKKLVNILSTNQSDIEEVDLTLKNYLKLIKFLNVKTVSTQSSPSKSETEKGKETKELEETKSDKKESDKKESDKKESDKKESDKKESDKEVEKKEVPLYRGCSFIWTNMNRFGKDTTVGGVDFEIASIKFFFGLWLIEKSHSLTSDQDPAKVDQQQKIAFQSIQKAAGIFKDLEESPYILPDESYCDLRAGIVKALHHQSLGLAQTIAIERAESGKQSEILIAGLCRGAQDSFTEAKNALTSPNPNPKPDPNKKWIAFLEFNALFYESKSYFYQGVHLSQPELSSIGKSVKILTEVVEKTEKCRIVLRNFMETPPTNNKHKNATILFNEFQQKSSFAYDKIKKENDMIYYEKVPDQLPEMVETKLNAQSIKSEEVEIDKSKWTDDMSNIVQSKKDKVEATEKLQKEQRQPSSSSSSCCVVL